jgi:hypothetical protein
MAEKAGVAVGKWLAGIIATVLAGVLTFVAIGLISRLDDQPGPVHSGTPAPGNANGPKGPPTKPTQQQLVAALLTPAEVGNGFGRRADYVDFIEEDARLKTTALDPDTARYRNCLSPQHTAFPPGTAPLATTTVELRAGDAVQETVVETLAGYDTESQASRPFAAIQAWVGVGHCNPYIAKDSNGQSLFGAQVTSAQSTTYGDEAVTDDLGITVVFGNLYTVAVTVRTGLTVCQVWIMTPNVQPAPDEIDRIVKAAYGKVSSPAPSA